MVLTFRNVVLGGFVPELSGPGNVALESPSVAQNFARYNNSVALGEILVRKRVLFLENSSQNLVLVLFEDCGGGDLSWVLKFPLFSEMGGGTCFKLLGNLLELHLEFYRS